MSGLGLYLGSIAFLYCFLCRDIFAFFEVQHTQRMYTVHTMYTHTSMICCVHIHKLLNTQIHIHIHNMKYITWLTIKIRRLYCTLFLFTLYRDRGLTGVGNIVLRYSKVRRENLWRISFSNLSFVYSFYYYHTLVV